MKEQIQHYREKLNYEWDSADLFEGLEERNDIIVVDTRKEFAYKAEHIPGAISFPHRQMNVETTAHLDRNAIYVCYCDGIGCNASTKGSLKLTELGFTVRELIGGIDWWKRDGYTTNGEVGVKGVEIQCAC